MLIINIKWQVANVLTLNMFINKISYFALLNF